MTTTNTTTPKTTTFTLVNPDGQYLKYFYAKHTDPAQVIQFNLAGSQMRFHTCNSEKAIQRVLDKSIEMSIAAEVAEVELSVLAGLRESTKDLPRLRNMKLVEKVEKPVKPKKAKKQPEPDTTEAEADMLMPAEAEVTPEAPVEKVAQEAAPAKPKKKPSSKKAEVEVTEAPADEQLEAVNA